MVAAITWATDRKGQTHGTTKLLVCTGSLIGAISSKGQWTKDNGGFSISHFRSDRY